MPAATIYANRAASIKSTAPYTPFPAPQPKNVITSYRLGDSRENVYAIFGFSVPQELYGKQVVSGTIAVTRNPKIRCDMCNIRGVSTPTELDVNTLTWDSFTGIFDFTWQNDPYSATQIFTGNSERIARAANGICVHVHYTKTMPYSGATTILEAPLISLTYTDNTVPALEQFSLEGYRNPFKIIQLPFRIVENIIGPITVTATKLRWRKRGEANYVEIDLASVLYPTDTIYTYFEQPVPPNTFPRNSTIEWQLQLQINNQWWSQNTAWNTLSTVDSISNASPVEPVNAMINVEAANTFRWQHVIATGSDPTGYELQYTLDGYTWRALAARTGTAETSCTVAANVLPAGKLQWRVRTLNGDGIAGTWSEPAAIIGYGAPPAPIISGITNTARPTIRWQSDTQIAYELIIRQGDKELLHVGETAGTDKAYTVADFLADGTYTVLVRIENSGLYWSQWASAGFVIQTQKPAPPVITGQPIQNGVMVMTAEVPDALYLLRDGVPIAKLFGGQAADYGAVGPHEYVVRRVNAAGAFSDSAPLILETKVEQAVIAPAYDPSNVIGPLLQAVENEYPSTANLAVETKHYAGRRYPVAVTSGAIEEEYSPVFAALNSAHWRALRSLMEEAATVLYRNSAGDCAHCVIIALNPTKAHGGYMTWESTLARVDYVERIEYDEVI